MKIYVRKHRVWGYSKVRRGPVVSYEVAIGRLVIWWQRDRRQG
jgi:hypothetical protein